MDYEKAWRELAGWVTHRVVDDPINGVVFLDVLDKMDELWWEDNGGKPDGV